MENIGLELLLQLILQNSTFLFIYQFSKIGQLIVTIFHLPCTQRCPPTESVVPTDSGIFTCYRAVPYPKVCARLQQNYLFIGNLKNRLVSLENETGKNYTISCTMYSLLRPHINIMMKRAFSYVAFSHTYLQIQLPSSSYISITVRVYLLEICVFVDFLLFYYRPINIFEEMYSYQIAVAHVRCS